MGETHPILGKWELSVSNWVSVLFHPILLPTWLYISLVFFTPTYVLQIPAGMEWVLAAIIFILSFLFPSLILLLLVRLKIIRSILLNERIERNGPILISAIFFFLTYYLLDYFGFIPVFGYYLLCATSISLLTMMINSVWKISLHATGHGATLGTFLSLAMLVEIPLLLIAFAMVIGGITATARLKLQAHTQAEIYGGYALGFVTMMLLFRMIS
jgi:hypothetical protein